MPTIPNGMIPVVSPAGYSHTGPSGAMRTEVSGGLARYGLDFYRGSQLFNVALILSADQFHVWTLFFHNVINLGTISFTMPIDSGTGRQDHTCNIVPDSYNVTHNSGTTVTVTFQVEAESLAYTFNTDESNTIIEIYNTSGSAELFFNQLTQFATVDSNVLDF